MILALYRCLACAFEWSHPTGPVACPRCDHVYVKWTNYDPGIRWAQ